MAYQEVLATDSLNEGREKINDNFVELYSAIEASSPVSITGAISLNGTALGKIHVCTGTSADYTVDLPTAVGNTGQSLIIKGANALTKIVTLAGVSGQTIDGESSLKMASCGMFTLISDGSNWVVVNEVGSWIPYTPVWTGFSVDPTITRSDYFRVGKLCRARIVINNAGTASGTTFTVTIPFNAAEVCRAPATVVGNNGTIQAGPGLAQTRSGSNVVDMYRDASFGTWTNASTKRADLDITFRIA